MLIQDLLAKKLIIILAASLLMPIHSFCQEENSPQAKKDRYTLLIGERLIGERLEIDTVKRTFELTKRYFKSLINNEFANIMGSQSRANIGNFASVDLAKAEASYNGSVVFRNGDIVGIKASGEVLDGFIPIFSNEELNTQFNLDLQYNTLIRKNVKLRYDFQSYRNYQEKIKVIKESFNLDSIKVKSGNIKNSLLVEIQDLQNKIIKLKTEDSLASEREKVKDSLKKLKEEELNAKIKKLKTKIDAETNESKDDSLNYEVKKLEYEINEQKHLKDSANLKKQSRDFEIKRLTQEIKTKENKIKDIPDEGEAIQVLSTQRDLEIEKLESNTENPPVTVTGFKLRWISGGYNIKTIFFNSFFSDADFANQVVEESNISHKLNVQYSVYNVDSSPFKSYFFTGGVSVGLGNNFMALEEVELNEKVDYGNPSQIRYSTKKYNAYTGEFKEDLLSLSLYTNTYWFLFSNNFGALHVFPEYTLQRSQRSIINFGAGLVLFFKDASKNKNIVNTELYINLKDVENANNSEVKLIDRSEVGLRFTVPIAFKFN